jgi:hypothetical protein
MFGISKISHIFAPELPLERSIQVFVRAAFFVFACNATSIGCCNPSDSRLKASIDSRRSGFNSLFLLYYIFNPIMRESVKNEGLANHSSTSRVAHVTSASTHDTGKYTTEQITPAPEITVTVTLKRNNQFMRAIAIGTYRFVAAIANGDPYPCAALVQAYKAAKTLYPEDMQAVIGKTVKRK